MSDPVFFPGGGPVTLDEIAALAGIALPAGVDGARMFASVATLESAGPGDLAYMDNPRYSEALAVTKAGACLVSPRFAAKVSEGTIALVTAQPYRVFAQILSRLYPTAMRPQPLFSASGVSPGAVVHPDARLESGVAVDPGAVIGPGVEIGSGTLIGANAVIGTGVRIGRDCRIGAGVSLSHSLLGNRVIIHPGASIGQDGFGFAMSGAGHLKVPQIGRVIIQDDVEVGANTTIDRGASRDTIVGEGTKIDNLVQIGHNVMIGRHCVIVSHVGISGSTTLGDFVVLGGQAGVVGHVTIGSGVQVAAGSGVTMDLPPGTKWGGAPAKPLKAWMREIAWLKRMVANRHADRQDADNIEIKQP
ncbi:UDP-3-O-(3-hydroxymyristoyl)glucosamine N-acyltransferase [Pseudochelatococcus sp. G4_1912]|uniref:UDP-3-O-(3-hydroxymyristoyl)glucosamine N-acyltransferase n=1 Tax=Pseudochelatococcus sp. G4_1912 TaxID=3114288 RepID=UPI0039C6AA50